MRARFVAFFVMVCAWGGAHASAEGGIGKEVKAQIWAEAGLKRNLYYLHVLNPAVSNYGTDEEKLIYKHCVNRQLQARVYFLSFQFNLAYKEVRSTQYLLIQLYERIIERSRREVLTRLSSYAPRILYGRNVRTRKYLSLGLRDLEVAQQKVVRARNMRQWLFLLRLDQLTDAQKLVRHANRFYVLIAIELESIYPRDPRIERLSFVDIQRLLISGFPGRQREFLRMHADNYFRVAPDSPHLLDLYRENPEFSILSATPGGWRLDYPRRVR